MFEISFSGYDLLVSRAEEEGYKPYVQEKKDIVDLLYLEKTSMEMDAKKAANQILLHDTFLYDKGDKKPKDKFCITFDDYDELEEIADSASCRALIPDENTLLRLLKAALCEDLEYKKAIHDILMSEICLVHNDNIGSDSDSGKELSKEEMMEASEIALRVELSGCSFFPTKEEINRFVSTKTKENIGFLTWLTNQDPESLSEDQIKVQKYAEKKLKEMIKK